MDLQETIRKLQLERERIDAAIASLEELDANTGGGGSVKKRRGRKSMSLEERREVAARMKQYWANRRRQRQAG